MRRALKAVGLAPLWVGLGAAQAGAVTPAQVSGAFTEAAVDVCLQSALSGGGVAGLPPDIRARLTAADTSLRELVRTPNASGNIWEIASARGLMVISEPAAGVCEVSTYGAPVERTFKATVSAARRKVPALAPVTVQPGYDPIVRRLETPDASAGVILELSGAEPGAPGHLFRFSTLTAKITRKPAQ